MKSFEERQIEYLAKVFELAGNQTMEFVDCKLVDRELGISASEGKDIFRLLLTKKLFGASLGYRAYVVPFGREVIEKSMERTYAEEELIVLQTAAELGKQDSMGWAMWHDLERAVGKLTYSMVDIANELERKGFFVPASDESVKVGPRGFEFMQKRANRDTGVSFSISTGHGSPVTIGDQNTVISNTSINPEFDKALASLGEIVKASSMPMHEIRLALDDLTELQKLVSLEKSPGIIARATKIIEGFQTLAGAAGLAAQIAPYIPHLLSAFNGG